LEKLKFVIDKVEAQGEIEQRQAIRKTGERIRDDG
jgi:hypothetical protein